MTLGYLSFLTLSSWKRKVLILCVFGICLNYIHPLWTFGATIDESFPMVTSSQKLKSYRIQFSNAGNCIGVSNELTLEVTFCDPTMKQTFRFGEDGTLVFHPTSQCLQLRNESNPTYKLMLGSCSDISLRFTLRNNHYLEVNGAELNANGVQCLSPLRSTNSTQALQAAVGPVLEDAVGLLICDNEISEITLIEENEFVNRRKALLVPQTAKYDDCDFPACGINKITPSVKLISPAKVQRCYNISECVTIVTKTAGRPALVLRMAQSVRDVKGYDLPIIAYDDAAGMHYPEVVMEEIAKFKNLKYFIDEREDVGIALGRNMALQHVKTKYFLLLDDDTVINDKTDIELLTRILDTTDATLVGGRFDNDNDKPFAGFFHFAKDSKTSERSLTLSRSACIIANETIVNFPSCVKCDTTKNAFMAKTIEVLKVGGWSEELKVVEHKDIFLRLKAADKKVVYCSEFQIYNRVQTSDRYAKLRKGRIQKFVEMFNNIWNIQKVYHLD